MSENRTNQVSAGVITRWNVITGAPCSGKTTVIQALSALGYTTVAEAARAEIDACLARGETLAAIKSDMVLFENRVLDRKKADEAALDPAAVVFLDRGMPDTIAYCRLFGLDSARAEADSHQYRYARVFCMDPLPFESDRVRSENREEARRLDKLIREAYHHVGYATISVPVLPVDQRVRHILSRITTTNITGT